MKKFENEVVERARQVMTVKGLNRKLHEAGLAQIDKVSSYQSKQSLTLLPMLRDSTGGLSVGKYTTGLIRSGRSVRCA